MNDNLSVVQNGKVLSIKNPLEGNDDIVYDNLINTFNFKCKGLNQVKNYNKLKLTLEPFNLSLKRVKIKIDKPIYFINRTRVQFVATSLNNEIIWHKYEGPLIGGGQNYIYIYGKRIKLSYWFNLNQSQRTELINLLTQN